MNGHKYEHRCAQMLRRKGFHHVEVTKKSGHQRSQQIRCEIMGKLLPSEKHQPGF